MLSRVANSLYWIARYLERAENTARLINVNNHLILDTPKEVSPGWEPLIHIVSNEQLFLEQFDELNERNVIRFLVTESQSTASIMYSLIRARENARTVRDLLPREVYEEINGLFLFARDHHAQALGKRNRYEYMQTIIRGVQQLTGMLSGTMSNNTPYQFMRVGRNLERGDMSSRIIAVRSASLLSNEQDLQPLEAIQWMSVLKSLSGYQMYRQYQGVTVRRDRVLQFLLQDASFPRAIFHCLAQISDAAKQIGNDELITQQVDKAQRVTAKIKTKKIVQADLSDMTAHLEACFAKIDVAMNKTYFFPRYTSDEADATA